MKKSLISLSLVSAMMLISGCSSKNNVDNENKLEVVSIVSKYMTQDIPVVKKCETTNIEFSNSTKKLNSVSSTMVGTKENINVGYEEIKSGNKTKIEYCKVGEDKLEVQLNIDFYNRYEYVEDNEKILVPNYDHKSTIVLERGKPVSFQDFQIVWTYK